MKILNKVVILLLVTILMITTMITANAEDSIQLGKAYSTKSYIADLDFTYKVTTDGEYLYCLNIHKDTAQNVKANRVSDSKNIDGGLVYILKNGFPTKSITGDTDKDYYITQTAVWWYLDKTTGSSNLGQNFKEKGSDDYNLRHYVKDLVNAGYQHRNDKMEVIDTGLEISAADGTNMVLKDNYYISNSIVAKRKNVENYRVSLIQLKVNTLKSLL